MPPLRLVFLGSDAIAQPMLDFLAGTPEGRALVEIVAVFTQPDRPHGRGQRLLPGPVKEWARGRGVPVHQPERLGPADAARVRDLGADVALVMAYGQILKEEFIAAPRRGTFDLHASLLPRYRGAAPVAAAIANGDLETGVSFMRIVRQLDAGAVADVERRPIGERDTTATVEAALSQAAAPLTGRCLAALQEGRLHFTEQNEAHATWCRRLSKDDGVLDFGQPAVRLARRVNALVPWPGCAVDCAGTVLKLGLAETLPGTLTGEPGEIIGADPAGLLVATAEGTLRLSRLQRPGGKMLPAGEFLRGFSVAIGTRLPSHPMPEFFAARKT